VVGTGIIHFLQLYNLLMESLQLDAVAACTYLYEVSVYIVECFQDCIILMYRVFL